MAIEPIVYASFILASGMFASVIGFYIQFLDKIKTTLKTKEDAIDEDVSKLIIEMMESLAKVPTTPTTPFPKEKFTEEFLKLIKKQFEFTERKNIIKEPYTWLKELSNAIFSAIFFFLVTGVVGLTQYTTYAILTLLFGIICVLYGVYKVHQIVDRITP